MSFVNLTEPYASPKAVSTFARPQGTRAGTLQCLIVSASPLRCEMFTAAAHEAGWDTVVCGDAEQGWQSCQRDLFQLAVVDLHSLAPTTPEGFQALTEQLAGMPNVLLVLCGHEGDGLEEIWARTLGAWLYLPGVSQASDIRALCDEARPTAEKLLALEVSHA